MTVQGGRLCGLPVDADGAVLVYAPIGLAQPVEVDVMGGVPSMPPTASRMPVVLSAQVSLIWLELDVSAILPSPVCFLVPRLPLDIVLQINGSAWKLAIGMDYERHPSGPQQLAAAFVVER